ncbi:glycosyltransferase 61 family protein [Tepidamorphus sp. 3E244]|uniref:glycosyltransferase 61 family protein n=1 Tax=Tepidamorphus sp. 3E244 TaxID=3385498 RepID=UPI0038FC370D
MTSSPDKPDRVWGDGGLCRVPGEPVSAPQPFDEARHLEIVGNANGRVINFFEELASPEALERTVMTRLHPTRGLNRRTPPFVPPVQIETLHLLHLRDAYCGDNVVFDADRYFRLGRPYAGDHHRLYHKTETIHHIEAGVLISALMGDAFQHFILDAMPQLAIVLNLLESPGFEHLRIVSHSKAAPFARWFWEKTGLADRVVDKPLNALERHLVHADHVLFPYYSPEMEIRSLYPRGVMAPLQARLGLLDEPEADLLVYAGRTNVNRCVSDEAPILDVLEQLAAAHGLGFRHFHSQKDWDADFDLFRRARVVVGPHGAGLSNIAFAPPGAHVVEFIPISRASYRPKHQRLIAYHGLSQACSHHHWAIEPIHFAFDEPGMRVDAQHVAMLVARILGESDAASDRPA